jgi:hypothetical protein
MISTHDAGEQGLSVRKLQRYTPAGAEIGDVTDRSGDAGDIA